MLLIPTFASEMSGVLSKLLDKQFLPPVASALSLDLCQRSLAGLPPLLVFIARSKRSAIDKP